MATQRPAVPTAQGVVLPNGLFRCTLVTTGGSECGSTMQNTKPSIKSHICKLHNLDSAYHAGQAKADHPCDRPKLNGEGMCPVVRGKYHSLIAHAHVDHEYQGNSLHLKKPWTELSDNQRNWYLRKSELKKKIELKCPLTEEEMRQYKEKFPDV
ncbi:hypothetical protein F5Y19DRAFT_476435 [Xylariaceae sp. FL1651]|nr:hypothetical protein F5Y19DRAFT_476435 [Xylariaceae sp. FL1651]